MKKKLFSIIIAFVLILTGVMCLTACNANSGVSLHNKTYTFGTDVTWSCYVSDGSGNKTNINNAVDYINEHWTAILQYNSALIANCQNAQQFVDALQERILDPNDTQSDVLLRGAVITIGKENKKTESVWESTFECKMNNEQVAYFDKIFTNTLKKNRYKAYKDGGSFDFELTDYNSTSGNINKVYTKFQVRKSINGGSGNNYINVFYSNVSSVRVYLGSNQFLDLKGTVNLVSVK